MKGAKKISNFSIQFIESAYTGDFEMHTSSTALGDLSYHFFMNLNNNEKWEFKLFDGLITCKLIN